MPLLECPECAGKVSDRAQACPHCGYPIQSDVEATHHKDEQRPGDGEELGSSHPVAWEHRLLAQTVAEEVLGASKLKAAYMDGGATSPSLAVYWDDFDSWGSQHIEDLRALGNELGQVVNIGLSVALQEARRTGDGEAVVAIARQLGDVYESALEWSCRVPRPALSNDSDKITGAGARPISRRPASRGGGYGCATAG